MAQNQIPQNQLQQVNVASIASKYKCRSRTRDSLQRERVRGGKDLYLLRCTTCWESMAFFAPEMRSFIQ